MKNSLMGRALLAAVLITFGSQAHALLLTPESPHWESFDTNALDANEVASIVGTSQSLSLYYKANVNEGGDPIEEGSFFDSYVTVFENEPDDPEDATVTYTGGASIVCPECYLVVKDGNQDPAQYLFDLSGWNGTDDLVLTGFWPRQGAISHVAIFGAEVSTVPEPGTLALLGAGLIGFAGFSRGRTRARR